MRGEPDVEVGRRDEGVRGLLCEVGVVDEVLRRVRPVIIGAEVVTLAGLGQHRGVEVRGLAGEHGDHVGAEAGVAERPDALGGPLGARVTEADVPLGEPLGAAVLGVAALALTDVGGDAIVLHASP